MPLFRNTPGQFYPMVAINIVTGEFVSGDEGNITAVLSKDDADAVATDTTNPDALPGFGPGHYEMPVTQDEVNAHKLRMMATSTSTNVKVMCGTSASGVLWTVSPASIAPATQGVFTVKLIAQAQAAGLTVYATIRNVDTGQAWNGAAMTPYLEAGRATYAIALTDDGGGRYSATCPATLPAGFVYQIEYWIRLGAVPDAGDTALGSVLNFWDGVVLADGPTITVENVAGATLANQIVIINKIDNAQADIDGIESTIADPVFGLSALNTDLDAILIRLGANTDVATDPSAGTGTVLSKLRGGGPGPWTTGGSSTLTAAEVWTYAGGGGRHLAIEDWATAADVTGALTNISLMALEFQSMTSPDGVFTVAAMANAGGGGSSTNLENMVPNAG